MSNPNHNPHFPESEHKPDEAHSRGNSGARHSDDTDTKHDKKKRKLALGSHGQHRYRRHHHNRHHRKHEDQQPHHGGGMSAEELLEHFRQLLREEEGRPGLDIQKARNALEATAGNMEMAAQLYWDDYIASQAVGNAAPYPQEDLESDRKIPARRSESPSSYEDDEYDDPPSPSLRRSLDGEFGRAADDAQKLRAKQENDNDDDDDDANDEGGENGGLDAARGQHLLRFNHASAGQRGRSPREMEESVEDNGVDDQDAIGRRQRQVLRDVLLDQQARLDNRGESVSVSDDENGCAGVWKIVGTMVARLDDGDRTGSAGRNRCLPTNDVGRRVREVAAAVADKVLSEPDLSDERGKKRKLREDDEDDASDYISDSDWLEDEPSPVKDPLELLWGTANKSGSSNASVEENPEGNLVADEDADEKSAVGVPHTWLHASFSLSECGTGLIMQPPKIEDIEFFTWRQQQNQGRHDQNGVPPPYHCKAITAIMSIVTAMLYTGASIQGDEVNCTSAKKPFMELTAEDKKREFEGRLADALSALIFIAGKASLRRKRRALKKLNLGGVQKDIQSKMMKRRLRLIPTCTWGDDPSAGMPRQPDSPSYRCVQLAVSLTNIDDIRLFVLSNIRAFTSRGGVALLLETILRIHGTGVVARMIRRERTRPGHSETRKGLVDCTCEERQKKMISDKPLPASVRNDPSKLLDTTPDGHECVSVELISLLLTGNMHSSWAGWSTQGLDFGFLTKKTAEVGFQLARPEKPVWVLQGETCYSVLWLENGNGLDSRGVAMLDKPGSVLEFAHWNCWYELRNRSEFRLMQMTHQWAPPPKENNEWKKCRNPLEPRKTTDLFLERRQYKRVNLVSAGEHQAMLKKENQSHVTESDLEQVAQHPEDKKFYPKNYKMWRFRIGSETGEDKDIQPVGDIKLRTDGWMPYYRLAPRQQLMVDMKLGPKISAILWTRWPGARLDNFMPEGEAFPVV